MIARANGAARRAAAASSLVLLLAATPAAAQPAAVTPPGSSTARAAALFDKGRALYDAGRFAEACGKLAESQKLEPRVGTEGLLASCREQEGRLATAYRGYLAAERRARAEGDPRAHFAAERAAALEPRVPRLRIRMASPPPGSWVTLDGVPVPPGELGGDMLVDPGAVVIEAGAPGRASTWAVVRLEPGAHAVAEIPALGPAAPASNAAERKPPSARRTAGWIAGALGLAGVGVGASLSAVAVSRRDASDPYCDAADRCTPAGGALRDEARAAAGVATASFAVGLAGLSAGALLLLLPEPQASAPGAARAARAARAPQVLPIAAPGAAGAVIRGSF